MIIAADGFRDPAAAQAIAHAYGDRVVWLTPAQKQAFAGNAITPVRRPRVDECRRRRLAAPTTSARRWPTTVSRSARWSWTRSRRPAAACAAASARSTESRAFHRRCAAAIAGACSPDAAVSRPASPVRQSRLAAMHGRHAGRRRPRRANGRTWANPVDIDYRYNYEQMNEGISYRTGADPAVVRYGDAYYLFQTLADGYWRSDRPAALGFRQARSLAVRRPGGAGHPGRRRQAVPDAVGDAAGAAAVFHRPGPRPLGVLDPHAAASARRQSGPATRAR